VLANPTKSPFQGERAEMRVKTASTKVTEAEFTELEAFVSGTAKASVNGFARHCSARFGASAMVRRPSISLPSLWEFSCS
jgi:hypothetical protein